MGMNNFEKGLLTLKPFGILDIIKLKDKHCLDKQKVKDAIYKILGKDSPYLDEKIMDLEKELGLCE
jgi:hypothetical protein